MSDSQKILGNAMSKLILAAVLAAAALYSPAFAADIQDPPSQPVSTKGVDFNDTAAVRAFHARLEQAALAVCDNYRARSRVTAEDKACAAKAVDQAVRAADRPLLTAIHQGARERAYAQR